MAYKIQYNPLQDRIVFTFEASHAHDLMLTRRQVAKIIYQLHRVNEAPEEIFRLSAAPSSAASQRRNQPRKNADPTLGDDRAMARGDASLKQGAPTTTPILVQGVGVLKTRAGACVSLNYLPPEAEQALSLRVDLLESDIATFSQRIVDLCQRAGWDIDAAHRRMSKQSTEANIKKRAALN